MLHVEPRGEGFVGQYQRLSAAEERLVGQLTSAQRVVKRLFLSDAANQAPLLNEESGACAVSVIQQPPLDGSKVAMWIYLNTAGGTEHNGYTHMWQMGLTQPCGGSAAQTASVLERYAASLDAQGANLERDCVRTWFYVRDVDTQYAGMVEARKEHFLGQGLTPDTHYISSTGIHGIPADRHAIIQLDTYAVKGLASGQQYYVRALSHLNPTIEYGVTFERGTVVDYGDRSHCLISGTASIDNQGRVVHVGDIRLQTLRMWENVEALLREGGFQMDDMAHIIVYLRDMADYATVKQMFAERFPDVPVVLTLAPVCRPEWLIEMECMAIRRNSSPAFRNF